MQLMLNTTTMNIITAVFDAGVALMPQWRVSGWCWQPYSRSSTMSQISKSCQTRTWLVSSQSPPPQWSMSIQEYYHVHDMLHWVQQYHPKDYRQQAPHTQAGDSLRLRYSHLHNRMRKHHWYGTRWPPHGSQAPPSHPLSEGAANCHASIEHWSLLLAEAGTTMLHWGSPQDNQWGTSLIVDK